MHLLQPMPDKWNVVIIEERHEEQIFASSSTQRLRAHGGDVRDVEFVFVSFRNNHRDIWS
jgi:hypothetical protein